MDVSWSRNRRLAPYGSKESVTDIPCDERQAEEDQEREENESQNVG